MLWKDVLRIATYKVQRQYLKTQLFSFKIAVSDPASNCHVDYEIY